MGSRSLAATAFGLFACSSASELRVIDLPSVAAGTGSIILVVDSDVTPAPPAERLMLHAFAAANLSSALVTLELDETPTIKINMLTYDASLGALGLSAGRIELAGSDGRGLPEPEYNYAWLEPADGRGWREEPYSDALRMLRIKAIDPPECLRLGGCLTGDGNAVLCNLACDPGPEPLPPAPPLPPTPLAVWLGACPIDTATTTLVERSVYVCEPPPALLPCGPAEAQPPNATSCVGLDAQPCPRFSAIPLGMTVVYVDPTSAPGGTGRDVSPLRTIAEAIALTNSGQGIALAAGNYLAPLTIDNRSLLGACASTTMLGPITFRGTGRISGASIHSGLTVDSTADLHLENVAISGGSIGIDVDGGLVTGHGLVIRDAIDLGIRVTNGGCVNLSNAFVEGDWSAGLRVEGAAANFDDVVIRGGTAWSIDATDRASLTLRRVLLEKGVSGGLYTFGATVSVDVADLVVRDYGPDSVGLRIGRSDSLLARRVLVERTGQAALSIAGRGTVEDFQAANISSGLVEGQTGEAIGVRGGGDLELSRARLAGFPFFGLSVRGSGARAVVSDLWADGAVDQYGIGILVESGHLEIDRAMIGQSTPMGLWARDPNSTVIATDLELAPRAGGMVAANVGTLFRGERVSVHDVFAWGVTAGEGARIEMKDLRVSRVQGRELGAGIAANVLDQLDIDRFTIEDGDAPATDLNLIGIYVGEKHLSHGRIRGNAIAIKIMPVLQDLVATFDHVLFQDNERIYSD